MIRPAVYRTHAKSDAVAAIQWLEQARPGFGAIFLEELRAIETRIAHHPELYQRFRGQSRRAAMHLFGYAVVYRALPDTIQILAVMHCRMDPSKADSRVSDDP